MRSGPSAESAYGGLTDEEQIKHDKEMTTEQDYLEYLEFRVTESREEGRKEAKLETARNLKAMGLEKSDIAAATGLSLERIECL